jgi:WD40 repeat protein
MLEADIMSAKRFALFDPTSPLNRLRACTRTSDKLRGYFHWLAARKVSEQEAAPPDAAKNAPPRNLKPVYRVFRAGKPGQPLAADVTVSFVADKDSERRLTVEFRLKHSADFPLQEVACRVYLLEKPILERLARRVEVHRNQPASEAASTAAPPSGTLAIPQHNGAVHALAVLSPRCIASCGDDGQVRIWDPETGSTQTVARHRGRVRALAATADGRLVSAGEDGCVQLWDPAARSVRNIAHHDGPVGALAVLPDQAIVSGGEDGVVRRWDPRYDDSTILAEEGAWVESLCPIGRLGRAASQQRDPRLAAFLFTPLGGTSLSCDVAIGYWDGTVGLASPAGAAPRSVAHHRQAVTHLQPLPDGRFVSGSDDGAVQVTNPVGSATQTILEHTGPVLDLAVLPAGQIVSAGEDGQVQRWDPAADEAAAITRHAGEATALAVLPDGRIASGGSTGTLRLWGPDTGLVRQVGRHDSRISALAALPDGRIISADKNGMVHVTDPAAAETNVVAHLDAVVAVAALPDGRIASTDVRGCLRVWGPDDDTLLTLTSDGPPMIGLAALSDGRLVAGSASGALTVWASVPGKGRAVEERSSPLLCLAACPDDTIVFAEATGGVTEEPSATPSRLCLWRSEAGVCGTLEVGRAICSVAGLADGRILYNDSADMVHLWDPQTGAVQTLAWQQQGRIAAALPDGRILWDTGAELQVWAFPGGDRQAVPGRGDWTALAVLPDGRLVAGDRDGVVRMVRLTALASSGPQAAFLPAVFRDDFLANDLEAVRLLSAAPEIEGVVDGRGRARLAKALIPGGEPAVTAADLCERVFFAIVLDQ